MTLESPVLLVSVRTGAYSTIEFTGPGLVSPRMPPVVTSSASRTGAATPTSALPSVRTGTSMPPTRSNAPVGISMRPEGMVSVGGNS